MTTMMKKCLMCIRLASYLESKEVICKKCTGWTRDVKEMNGKDNVAFIVSKNVTGSKDQL